jgi:hypothetical protein
MKNKKPVEAFFDKLFAAIEISLNDAAKIGKLEKRVLASARNLTHGKGGDTWTLVTRVDRCVRALEREQKRQSAARGARRVS